MLQTSYVHSEDYIVRAALYGMISMCLYRQSTRLKDDFLMTYWYVWLSDDNDTPSEKF